LFRDDLKLKPAGRLEIIQWEDIKFRRAPAAWPGTICSFSGKNANNFLINIEKDVRLDLKKVSAQYFRVLCHCETFPSAVLRTSFAEA